MQVWIGIIISLIIDASSLYLVSFGLFRKTDTMRVLLERV